MKERPILFKGQMVRAIIEGIKTQTRRIIKDVNPFVDAFVPDVFQGDPVWAARSGGDYVPVRTGSQDMWIRSKYGVPGDRLWVRETWQVLEYHEEWCEGYPTGYGDLLPLCHIPEERGQYAVDYAATSEFYEWHKGDRGYGWRPSIHMPRWASRILLEVVDVRVERVGDINDKDALAEGMDGSHVVWPPDNDPMLSNKNGRTTISQFRDLWNDINAAPKPVVRRGKVVSYEAYPFNEFHPVCQETSHRGLPLVVTPNPYVFVTEFKNITGPKP